MLREKRKHSPCTEGKGACLNLMPCLERHVAFSILGRYLFRYHYCAVIERLAESKWFKTMTAKKLARRFSDFSFAEMGLQP